MVSVKKLAENMQIPAGKQFDNEATNLFKAQHENVVKLLGFCGQSTKKMVERNGRFSIVEKDEFLLCYEHVPKGSLRCYLSGMIALFNILCLINKFLFSVYNNFHGHITCFYYARELLQCILCIDSAGTGQMRWAIMCKTDVSLLVDKD